MVSLYLTLLSTFEATSSILGPVCLFGLLCDSTDAASAFAVLEELGFDRTPEAIEETRGDDVFLFLDIFTIPCILNESVVIADLLNWTALIEI